MICRLPVTDRSALESHGETYVASVRGGESNICHDRNHHVLLGVEPAGIESPCVPEGGELSGREDRFQKFAGGEGQQLSDIGCDRDTGLTNTEELVNESSAEPLVSKCAKGAGPWQGSRGVAMIDIPGCNKDRSDEPGTESACRYCRVVMVINHSTNLGVR